MSQLSEADYMDEAKRRLNDWGAEDWRQRQLSGFARETLEQVMADYRMIPHATGMRKEVERPDIIEIDEIVSKLGQQPGGQDIVRALWTFHAVRKRERDGHGVWHEDGRLSQNEVAAVMGRSRAQVRSWLESGWWWVAAALAHRGYP